MSRQVAQRAPGRRTAGRPPGPGRGRRTPGRRRTPRAPRGRGRRAPTSPSSPLRSRACQGRSGCSSRYWMSMPNCVPQSPRWLLADDVGAEVVEHAGEASPMIVVAQVADVHLLGDVRRRVVDDRALAEPGARDAETVVVREVRRDAAPQFGVRHRDVEEAGARHLDRRHHVAVLAQPGGDLLRDLHRRAPQALAQRQRHVRLQVRERRRAHERVGVGGVGRDAADRASYGLGHEGRHGLGHLLPISFSPHRPPHRSATGTILPYPGRGHRLSGTPP